MKQKSTPSQAPRNLVPPPLAGGGRGRGRARASEHAVEGQRAALEVREGPVTPYLGEYKQPVLGQFTATKTRGVVPANTPEQTFELYSVPAFESRQPEIVTGAQIGSNKQVVEPGTVLLCKINPRINRSWVVGSFSTHSKIASTEWITFPRHDDVEPKYLAHFLSQDRIRQFLASNASGVGGSLMRVKPSVIRDVPLPLPPLAEQRRIVAELETQLTRLDASVTALKRVQANLKRYRASVLKAACEGRLIPTEAEIARDEKRSYESAAELIQKTSAPPRPNRWASRSKDTIYGHAALAVGEIASKPPEGWVWVQLVDIARMESGHTPSRNHPEWWDGSVPWIGIADARDHDGRIVHDTLQHTNDDGLANSAARLLPAGTVCISRTASVGYVVVMGRSMATSQDFVNWIPTAAVTSEWLRILFSADREALRRFGKGTVHKTIYFPEWLSVRVALPPLAEQHRIVAEVERRLSVIEELEAIVAANLQRAERLRQSVLARAFAGAPAEATRMTA
jgi:type I restriction enzyme, S subunit